MKIKTKTYLSFLFLGTFLTFLGVVVYFIFFSSSYEKIVLKNLETLTSTKESDVDVFLDHRTLEFLEVLELDQEIDYFLDEEYFLNKYKIIAESNKDIDDIFLVDKEGMVLFSANKNKIENIVSDTEDKKMFSLSSVIFGKTKKDLNGYYQYVSYPITGNDLYLIVRYNLDSVINLLSNIYGLGDGAEVVLAVKDGADISFINNKNIEDNNINIMEAEPMRKALEGKKSSIKKALDYNGTSVMAAYSYIDRLELGLVVKVDRKVALSFFEEMLLVSILLGIAIILLVYLAAGTISKKIIEPIEELNNAVEIVSKGNWDYKIDISEKDEISKTANAFHKMAQDIKKSKEKTDKRIEEQTANLRDQQMAILNILEDVEAEKEKVANTAKELEKFKQAVENTSDHVIITDENGIIIYANKAVETITGFSRDEVIGTKVGTKENWGGNMGRDFYDNLWQTIKKNKKSFSGYLKNVRKNGEEYEALANISPVFDAGGNVIFFIGIERDFTREREIDRAKSEFVSLASHQLRTPLSTVNWYAEILLSEDAGKINKEQKEYLGEIYKGNQRMVNLVNALLNVSRIDLGTLSIDPEPTSLVDLAESVLNELEIKIKERKHKIVRDFDEDIPDINLDPKMMRIVWQNYLTNAVKYTPEKGTIEVTIKKKKSLVEISVKDDGMGIPKVQQEKIFEKLFRADNAREKETDGTGLGLYIVKSIIEEFGGKVWFKSKKDKGSTFYATIPLKGIKAKEGSKGLEYID